MADEMPPAVRMTVDEISPDQDKRPMAVLVSDSSDRLIVPLSLLPEGTRVGDVLKVDFSPDPDEREQRRRKIAELQRRLFGTH